ncbi:hypothetical protein H9P43_007535 [Blastocladiella emersonii ATCC 22665]|nr:hypothetical protein H9P43_007535 [Blastocladiella emersonii ATCC 22665]
MHRPHASAAAALLVLALLLLVHRAAGQGMAGPVGIPRTVTPCIPNNVAAAFKWVEDASAALPTPDTPRPPRPPRPKYRGVTLSAAAWSSSNLTAFAAAILLRDVLGIDVAVREFPGDVGAFPRLADGRSDIHMEMWPSDSRVDFFEYVQRRGLVDFVGNTGYQGLIQWYMPAVTSDLHRELILDSWRALLLPEVLALLPPAGTTPSMTIPPGSDECAYTWCTSGAFVPPQCQAGGKYVGRCRELWHVTPAYSFGVNEQLVVDLDLPLVVVYLGADTFRDHIAACVRRQEAAFRANATVERSCLFFYWAPELIPSEFALQPVHLPPYTTRAWAQWNRTLAGTNATVLKSGWQSEVLQKLAGTWVKRELPHVHSLLRSFKLRDIDLMSMLRAITTTDAIADIACAWLRDNREVWASWIPPAPVSLNPAYTPISALGKSIALPASTFLALIAAVAIGFLVVDRKLPALRVHSPGLLALYLVGTLVAAVGLSLDIVALPRTATCHARVWLTSLGIVICQAALFARVWRVFFVFSGIRLSAVVRGRLVTLRVSSKHLMAMVAAVAGVQAVLLGLWSAAWAAVLPGSHIVAPTLVDFALTSSGTYATVCRAIPHLGEPGAGLVIAAAAAVAFAHLAVAAATAWILLRIRNVVSVYYEPTTVRTAWLLLAAALPAAVLDVWIRIDTGDLRVLVTARCLFASLALVAAVAVTAVGPVFQASLVARLARVLGYNSSLLVLGRAGTGLEMMTQGGTGAGASFAQRSASYGFGGGGNKPGGGGLSSMGHDTQWQSVIGDVVAAMAVGEPGLSTVKEGSECSSRCPPEVVVTATVATTPMLTPALLNLLAPPMLPVTNDSTSTSRLIPPTLLTAATPEPTATPAGPRDSILNTRITVQPSLIALATARIQPDAALRRLRTTLSRGRPFIRRPSLPDPWLGATLVLLPGVPVLAVLPANGTRGWTWWTCVSAAFPGLVGGVGADQLVISASSSSVGGSAAAAMRVEGEWLVQLPSAAAVDEWRAAINTAFVAVTRTVSEPKRTPRLFATKRRGS